MERRALGALTSIVALVATTSGAAAQISGTPGQVGGVVGGDDRLTFAVIGDYGWSNPLEGQVADTIRDLKPDLVLTVGDNNYPYGERTTLDANIGQYYGSFIHPYKGVFGPGATQNRFFPTLGNHDLWNAQGVPYLLLPQGPPILRWLELPGNERYYDFVRGPVHFFALNSDPSEPDGVDADSDQSRWLEQKLAASVAPLQVVYFHHAPFSSSVHGSAVNMQWPFAEWGVDLVLTGHDHVYERLRKDGLTYVVNGVGGTYNYPFLTTLPESEFRYNLGMGFMLGRVDAGRLSLQFVGDGIVHDSFAVVPWAPVSEQQELVGWGSDWTYLDDGSDPGQAWKGPTFQDRAWLTGPAPLGYGNGGEATVVSFGGDLLDKHLTTYFRKSFSVNDPLQLKRLDLAVVRDDGIAVYVNGVEAHRSNLPLGPLGPETEAGLTIESPDQPATLSIPIHPALLVAGTNTLAVEVHQVQPASSDLAFDLRLTAWH